MRRYAFTMNGVTASAIGWVNALERLTLRTDLIRRTLLPLRGLVPRTKLLSEEERFCPSCYRDDEILSRQKYNRLLWSIECVESCPLHGTLLETVPKAPKHKSYTFWLPGLSRIDGTSLANRKARPASDQQIRTARLIAELLDDIHQRPEMFTIGASTGTFLQHAANTLFGGNISRLANHLGVPRSRVYHCYSGKQPSLLFLCWHISQAVVPAVFLTFYLETKYLCRRCARAPTADMYLIADGTPAFLNLQTPCSPNSKSLKDRG
ncbi:TniQ family protein [Paraburkholderia guartelaensis]|uniref:TniQ family protein n=1 Tax=Paraburkholderia guartelaensis TaxID=2546446 RepID=UPI002AB72224|nr:TniQ family protein [Paraburkholderia guartelaensis]